MQLVEQEPLWGALRIQRLEGSRSPESVLCIFYRIATSGPDRRTSVVDGVGGSRPWTMQK
jgi:hypothetical protein